MRQTIVCAGICALLATSNLYAQEAYKCIDGGNVTFSDRPCASGRQSVISTSPASASRDAPRTRYNPLVSQQQRAFNEAMRAGDLKRAESLSISASQRDAIQAETERRSAVEQRQQAQELEEAQRKSRERQMIEATNRAAAAAEQANKRAKNQILNCSYNFGSGTCVPVDLDQK